MSDSGLTLPTRTEAEARNDRALKVARDFLAYSQSLGDDPLAAGAARSGLNNIIRILSDGKSEGA